MLPIYLAIKEMWRSKARFLAVGAVIMLITTLVLFVAGLAEGLAAGNKEYIENLDADLLVLQADVDLQASSSQIGRSSLNDIRRIEGVAVAGEIGLSSSTVVFDDGREKLDVSLIGVQPGLPGEPVARVGQQLGSTRGNEAIIGRNVALRSGLEVGDTFTTRVVQGSQEEFYTLTVVGISDGQQFFIRPSIVVPYLTWDRIRPRPTASTSNTELTANMVALKLEPGYNPDTMIEVIEAQVSNVQAADIVTTYTSQPGYSEQQSSLDTQRYFTLLIGVLVIGGFFQIQMLQKVAQVGMLKAIGTSNTVIAISVVFQIIAITVLGVAAGVGGVVGLSLGIPPTVPIVFSQQSLIAAVGSLLLIGPIGGLVAVRLALRVEPLTALGLAS